MTDSELTFNDTSLLGLKKLEHLISATPEPAPSANTVLVRLSQKHAEEFVVAFLAYYMVDADLIDAGAVKDPQP